MRGGSCGVVDASLAATATASSVGAGGAVGAGSDAASGCGWTAASATWGAGSVDGEAITGAAGRGRGLRLGVARLATGAGGGGISVIVAESIGKASGSARGGCGSAATIRCASSDATSAPTRTPRGCARIHDAILVTALGRC